MAWPGNNNSNYRDPGSLQRMKAELVGIAKAISGFEPVTLIVSSDQVSDAERQLASCGQYGVDIKPTAADDFWSPGCEISHRHLWLGRDPILPYTGRTSTLMVGEDDIRPPAMLILLVAFLRIGISPDCSPQLFWKAELWMSTVKELC